MPGDFASVLLSTSPPMFSTSPRLAFNAVTDVTKSYFFRFSQYAAGATPGSNELLPSSVSSSTSDALDTPYASLANLTTLRLQSTHNGRCYSDTDMQRSWQFASAVIERCSLNHSEPTLTEEYKQAADKSRPHHAAYPCDDNNSNIVNAPAQNNASKETETHPNVAAVVIPANNDLSPSQSDLSALALLDGTPVSNPHGTCSSSQTESKNVRYFDSDSVSSDAARLNHIDSLTPSVPRTTEKQAATCTQNAVKSTSMPGTRSRNKKGQYVRFADELGKELNAVRVIENVLDVKSCTAVSDTDADCISSHSNPLVVEFAQPVADYARFRERLDTQNVSLENVLVSGFRVSGTVRVRNLAFEKRVFVRVSTDHWLSHTDHYATYIVSPNNANGNSAYDSFAFDLGDLSNKLQPRSSNPSWSATQQRIEIAVCFISGSQTFWDNNAGRNYIVSYTPAAANRSQKPYTSSYRPDFSAFRENFGEFTAWNHYDSYNPYY